MISIRFFMQMEMQFLMHEQVELLRTVIEATYADGTYTVNFGLWNGNLEATIVFETLKQDSAFQRTQAQTVATAVKTALGLRAVGLVITPGVEFTPV